MNRSEFNEGQFTEGQRVTLLLWLAGNEPGFISAVYDGRTQVEYTLWVRRDPESQQPWPYGADRTTVFCRNVFVDETEARRYVVQTCVEKARNLLRIARSVAPAKEAETVNA